MRLVNCVRFAVYTSATLPGTLETLKSTSCKWSRARTILASSRAKYNRHRKSQVLLTRRRLFPNAIAASESRLVWVTTLRERFSRIKNLRIAWQKSRPCDRGFKPHLHGRLFCNAIRRFLMGENLSRRVVTLTRRDSLTAIAFEKNRRRVSNTCDLRCRLYFARFDARIVLARDHLHKVDFNVSRVSGQSRARVNSKSYAIYESPRHSAMHKCFASRWHDYPKFASQSIVFIV